MGHELRMPTISPDTIERKNSVIDRGACFLAYKIVLPLMVLGGGATWVFTDADTTGQALIGLGVGIPLLHGISKLRHRYGHQLEKQYPDMYKRLD